MKISYKKMYSHIIYMSEHNCNLTFSDFETQVTYKYICHACQKEYSYTINMPNTHISFSAVSDIKKLIEESINRK